MLGRLAEGSIERLNGTSSLSNNWWQQTSLRPEGRGTPRSGMGAQLMLLGWLDRRSQRFFKQFYWRRAGSVQR